MMPESRICFKGSRCHRWRDCPECAAIRQARIADVADRLQSMYPGLAWTTLHPVTSGAEAIARARAAWARKSRVPAGLWTVESSPSTGNLHCNIIHPIGFDADISGLHRWQRAITGKVRHVAAYISKPEQFPRREDHPGRLYGTLGPLWQHLASARQEPTVAAAALEYAIDPGAAQVRAASPQSQSPQHGELSMDEYRQIAARHLPNLLHPRVRI
jgi:hypothetical protein